MTVEIQNENPKTRKTVKRKIDFEDIEVSGKSIKANDKQMIQRNNNATVRLKGLRSRSGGQHDDVSKKNSDRVIWTKEFMAKVCRSNEKTKIAAQNKLTSKNNVLQIDPKEKEVNTTRQVEAGICTQVVQELEEHDQDILDYEDDLSMEGDNIEVSGNSDTDVEQIEHDHPRPGTSGEQEKNFIDAMTKQPEKLMENPVIQKLM